MCYYYYYILLVYHYSYYLLLICGYYVFWLPQNKYPENIHSIKKEMEEGVGIKKSKHKENVPHPDYREIVQNI